MEFQWDGQGWEGEVQETKVENAAKQAEKKKRKVRDDCCVNQLHCDKIPEKINVEEKRFILTHSFRFLSMVV
jgi:hypothetical protein